MGGMVSGTKKRSTAQNGDWFSKQGYNLNIEITYNSDAVADGNSRVYDIGRFSCSLPAANPHTVQRNNEIYEHIKKIKSTSWSGSPSSRSPGTPGTRPGDNLSRRRNQ